MSFTVIYDACVLYPAPLRDLLLRIAESGIVRARWTEAILDECFKSIQRDRPDLNVDSLERTRQLMNQSVRDCLVTGYAELVEGLKLPDLADRHVLAAAIRAGAQAIVTANVKHFPDTALSAYHIEAVSPDEFVLDIVDLAPGLVVQIVQAQAAALKSPIKTVPELLETLRKCGLPQTVAKLEDLGVGKA